MGEALDSVLSTDRVGVKKDHDSIPGFQDQQRQQNHTGTGHVTFVTVIFLSLYKITIVIGETETLGHYWQEHKVVKVLPKKCMVISQTTKARLPCGVT